jgi:hypothetical protein
MIRGTGRKFKQSMTHHHAHYLVYPSRARAKIKEFLDHQSAESLLPKNDFGVPFPAK